MMIRYVFKADEPLRIKAAAKADPQTLGEEIEKIGAKSGKRFSEIEPDAVLEAARSTRSPLHPHFEWDDKKAAHAHRLDQARSLIRLIKVVDEKTGDVEPAYINLNPGKGHAYFPVGEIKKSVDLQIALAKQARHELLAAKTRFRMLSDVSEGIGEIIKKLDERIAAGERSAAA